MGSIKSWKYRAQAGRENHLENLRTSFRETLTEADDTLVVAQVALTSNLTREIEAFFKTGGSSTRLSNKFLEGRGLNEEDERWIDSARRRNPDFGYRCDEIERLIIEVAAGRALLPALAATVVLSFYSEDPLDQITLPLELQKIIDGHEAEFALPRRPLVADREAFNDNWRNTIKLRRQAVRETPHDPLTSANPGILSDRVWRMVEQARMLLALSKVAVYDIELAGLRTENAIDAILLTETSVQSRMRRLDETEAFAIVQEVGLNLESSLIERGYLDRGDKVLLARETVLETTGVDSPVLELAAMERSFHMM